MIAKIAISVAMTITGLGIALTAGTAQANPVNPAFGPISFHRAPVARRVVVEAKQIRENPGEPFAVWSGYSTFPDFTPAQKQMIRNGARGGSHGGPGGGPTGGGGGGTATVPYWAAQITSPLDNNTYTMSMVGNSPYASTPTAATITYVPIVLKITIGKVTYDPTQPACDDTVPVQTRFFDSPLFNPAPFNSNGVGISDQLASAFQRANFSASGNANYGVELTRSVAKPIVASVSLKGHNYNLTCSNGKAIHLGAVDINSFDSAIQSVIAAYSTPTELPVVLTYNIVESSYGQCCILGYHNAVAVSGGVQTYATGAYIDHGVFTNIDDIAIWSHEIAEWMDDPFVQAAVSGGGTDDLTPSWGHVGQVSTCQNNLEVGDPLTGTEFAIPGLNGFTYHYQDLAFKDWFYRTPSSGTGGRYSFMGLFTAAPPAC